MIQELGHQEVAQRLKQTKSEREKLQKEMFANPRFRTAPYGGVETPKEFIDIKEREQTLCSRLAEMKRLAQVELADLLREGREGRRVDQAKVRQLVETVDQIGLSLTSI